MDPFKGTAKDIREIESGLGTADPSSFAPIGNTVKRSIEDSENCNNTTLCEVPDFEFLSENGADDRLTKLINMLLENDDQLIICDQGRVNCSQNFE